MKYYFELLLIDVLARTAFEFPANTVCGICVSMCPTEAITLNDDVSTHTKQCIRCCAYIKNCPTGARLIGHDE